MKTFVKIVVSIIFTIVIVLVVVGPGKVAAGVEYPFGVGPWGSTGRYCHDIDTVSRLVDHVQRVDDLSLSARQRVTLLAFEKTLTHTGPVVPRADFTAFFRRTGHVAKTMTTEGALINTWWNQNCTEALMEAPAALGKVWSGLGVRDTFMHYPKNVVKVADFRIATTE